MTNNRRTTNSPGMWMTNDRGNGAQTTCDVSFGSRYIASLKFVSLEHCYDFKRFRQSSTVIGSKVQGQMSLEECKS